MRRFCFSSLLVALLLTACTDARDKDNFVLQGTVAEGVEDVRYLLYIIDDYGHIQLDVPVDTLEVRNGQFSFAMHIEEPVGGLLKGVHQDGNTDFQFKEFWAIPGDTCVLRITGCRYDEMEVHGGLFYAQYNAFKAYRDSLFQPVLEKGMELNGLSSEHPQDKAAFQQLTDELERLDEVSAVAYRSTIASMERRRAAPSISCSGSSTTISTSVSWTVPLRTDVSANTWNTAARSICQENEGQQHPEQQRT